MQTFPTLAAIIAEFFNTNFCSTEGEALDLFDELVDRGIVTRSDRGGWVLAEDSDADQIAALDAVLTERAAEATAAGTSRYCVGLTFSDKGVHGCHCGADARAVGEAFETGASRYVCATTGRPLGTSGL